MIKHKKLFITLLSTALTLSASILLGNNLKKVYFKDEYIPEENAYYGGEIKNDAGLIKAHKYTVPTDNKYGTQKKRSLDSKFIGDIESTWSSYTGKGTTVAIIDDGFDYEHPEYKRADGSSAILSTSRYYYTSGSSYLYKNYSDDPTCIAEDWESDGQGGYEWATHGTNTSTTAAAPMNNNGGVGIAPDADILALKIDFTFASIKGAISYAISQKVDVINMSLGAYAESFTDGWGDWQSGSSSVASYLEQVCKDAYNAGIIVVAAAGNESTYHKSYPACNYKVVGVGAIGDWDNKGNADKLAEFTNYVGSNQTGEINVDILAPGYVYTATRAGTEYSPTHTYDDTQGTSFSSPIVAGAACLWKQKYPKGTPDQFLNQLQSSADGIGYYKDKMIPVSGWYDELTDVGPSNITNGRLNVAKLLTIDDPYITLKQSSFNISINEKKQIDLETYNGTISYSSANSGIASVSSTGLVEGKSNGDTTITVTATKNSKTATATLPVHVVGVVACESLSINPNSINLNIGDTYDIEKTITVSPSNATRSFMFASDTENVASVDDYGLVTALKEGTATIEVVSLYGDGYDTLTVKVEKPSTPTYWNKITSTSELSNGDYLIVYEGSSVAFDGSLQKLDDTYNTINVEISNNKISWSLTNNASRFTINAITGGYSILAANGLYIGKDNNSKGIETSSSPLKNSIEFDEDGTALIQGTSGKSLLFNIDSQQLRFRYVNNGESICLYKADSSSPTPEPEISGVTVTPSSLSLDTGSNKTGQLTATVQGTGTVSQSVNWESSNPSVATVDNNGEVTAVSVGQVTIKATSTVDTTKFGTCIVTVTDAGDIKQYSGTFNIENVGTTWTLSNYENKTTYMLCPSNDNTSVALMSGIFSDKAITSDVKITIYCATYGSGDNPISSTFTIFNSANCSSKVKSTQSGSLPNSTTFTNAIYTVEKSDTSSFVDDLAIKITKPGKQIRLKSITVEFSYSTCDDKIISSLSASYNGGSIYVGGSLDETKVGVTATYTDSAKYPSSVLKTNEYTISGFSSTSAGEKVVTVTYCGSLPTSVTPLTTTFKVQVIADDVTNVNVTNSKHYHPGEVIVKSDITVTLTYKSGRTSTTTDFTFNENNYQFTYSDTNSGGTSKSKQFSVIYAGNTYNFNVNVSRNNYQTIGGSSKTLSSNEFNNSTISKSSGTPSSTSVTIDNVGFTVTKNCYIYKYTKNSNTTYYLSFGKGAGSIQNTNAFSSDLTSVTFSLRDGSRTDGVLTISRDGTNWDSYSLENLDKGGYRYFKIAYKSSSDTYSNIASIEYKLSGQDNPTNVANYIMFEDANNQCKTKLNIAINKLNSMSSADKNTFNTSNDYVISTARERLNAWARHEGKTINLESGSFKLNAFNNGVNIIDITNSNSSLTIVLITSLIALSLLGGYIFIKKRKLY